MASIKFSKNHKIKEDKFVENVLSFKEGIENNAKIIIVLFSLAIVLAISMFVYGINKKNNNAESNSILGDAIVKMQHRDFNNAITSFKKVTANFPSSKGAILASYYLGSIYFDIAKYDLAEKSYQEYINKYSGGFLDPMVYKSLAYTQIQNKNIDAAILTLKDGLKKNPDTFCSSEMNISLVRCLIEKNQNKEAKAICLAIIKKEETSLYGKEASLIAATL